MAEDMRYVNVPPKNIRKRRLLIFLPVVVVLLFFYIIGYKANAVKRDAANFTDATNLIATQSNFLGSQFRAALNSDSKSKFLNESLENMVEQALTHSQRAEAIEPPEDLRLAHSFFVVSMKIRHQGLEKYSRKVLTALNQKSLSSAADEALKDISLSDISFNYYLQETRRYLSSNNLKINLKNSNFLTAQAKKKIATATEKRPAEKKEEAGQPNLAILDVATKPLRVSFNPDNDIRVLPDTNSVDVRIKIQNKGQTGEEDIPIEVELLNDSKSIAKKDMVLSKITAGATEKVTIGGFKPPHEGLNVFKVQVGPLAGEQNKDDNSYTYKFIFRSQDNPG